MEQVNYKAADNDYNQKKDILKKLLKDAESNAPMTVWNAKFEQEGIPESLEGVDEAIDEMENKVSNITDNPHVMRQYEERKREISKLEAQKVI
jgi:DNA repair ATPase RecN